MKVVHCKKEEYDVYIGRPSKWGNPFSHKSDTMAKFKVDSREEAIKNYEVWITEGDGSYLLDDLYELEEKTIDALKDELIELSSKNWQEIL